MEQLIYLNGALVPRDRATISPFDHGFLYGYGLFETMRAYSGYIFRLEQHLRRLANAAAILGLPLGTIDLEEACYATLRANKLGDARIRLAISIGEGESTPDPPTLPDPTIFIVATGYVPPPPERYMNGFKAVVSSIRQNSLSPLSHLKSANYLNHVLARKEARAAGADEALLLNERDLLCEGSTSNVFLVKEDELVTPGEESGCLPGITRQTVIEIASALSITIVQKEVRLEEFLQADEAFITNSLLELMPLSEVDGKPLGGGAGVSVGGGTVQRLRRAYGELVRRELEGPLP
jgi:branched-chain amino acid aminotransferase group I